MALLMVWIGAAASLPPAAPQQCGIASHDNTLGRVSSAGVRMVAAEDAAGCCAACSVLPAAACVSWSMQHLWTPRTPCHLSPYRFLSTAQNSTGNSCGTVTFVFDVFSCPPDTHTHTHHKVVNATLTSFIR